MVILDPEHRFVVDVPGAPGATLTCRPMAFAERVAAAGMIDAMQACRDYPAMLAALVPHLRSVVGADGLPPDTGAALPAAQPVAAADGPSDFAFRIARAFTLEECVAIVVAICKANDLSESDRKKSASPRPSGPGGCAAGVPAGGDA